MKKDFNKYFEHTTLDYDIQKLTVEKQMLDALKYNFHGATVDGYYIPLAYEYLKDSDISIVTICSLPLGTDSTNSKVASIYESIQEGAEEIDVMMNMAAIKDRRYDYISAEMKAIAEICHRENVKVKAILETTYMTDEEIIKVCEIAMRCNIDAIRDSSGFNRLSATVRTVKLIKETIGDSMELKVAGSFATLAQAMEFIEAGADKLCTDYAVDIMEEYRKKG